MQSMHFTILLIFIISFMYISYFLVKRVYQLWFIKNPETIPCNLSINQVTNAEECKRALSMLVKDCQELGALGFDCEWVTEIEEGKSVQKPVSLLQLASKSNFCCLFRLNILRQIPSELQAILENNEILKLGVNCYHDCKLIEKDYGVKVKSFLDLRHLYPGENSLASLAKNVIGVHLKKDVSITCTNWNQEILTDDQITYAAKDAWVAIEIFKSWLRTNSVTKMCFDDLGIQRYIDLPFVSKKKDNKNLNYIKEKMYFKNLTAKFARKTPLYHNCWMYAPDGELLCSCDRRKAEWYVARGLAEACKEEPFSIKLLFEPNARPNDDAEGEFYKQLKQNSCVICNSQESCMRHYVVPREYRKHFPPNMKSHQSHDIVLTCGYCHSKAKMFMRKLKEELAEKCNAPVCTPPSLKNKQLQKVKNICRTLLTSGQNIPTEKREQLEKIVQEYSGLSRIDNEVLKEISKKKITEKENPDNHGKKVVDHYLAKDQLTELEKLWRKSFLDNMKPKFLPQAWSVNHNHKTKFEGYTCKNLLVNLIKPD